jgi:hypothetical protein
LIINESDGKLHFGKEYCVTVANRDDQGHSIFLIVKNMQYKLYKCLSIILFPVICFSQTNYSRVFNYINGNEYGIGIQTKKDSVFIQATGVCDPGTLNSRGCYYVLSLSEENKKTYILDRRTSFASARPSFVHDDTIYTFGVDYRNLPEKYTLKVFKMSFNADSLGILTYLISPNKKAEAESILVKGNHIYLYGNIANENGERSVYLLQIDKSGNVLRDERFPDFVHPPKFKLENLSRNLVETTDGNMAISSAYVLDDNMYVGVCKFDDNFNTIWQLYLSVFGSFLSLRNPWTYMVASKDTGLVVSKEINLRDSLYWPAPNPDKYKGKEETAVTLTKLNKNGNIVWSDTLFTDVFQGKQYGPYRIIRKLFQCINGDILCIGSYNCHLCDPENYAFLARYSNDGMKKWEHFYNNPIYAPKGIGTHFLDAKEAENGDLICIGFIDDTYGEWNNSTYTWLLRLDSLGCYTPGCDVSDTMNEILITANKEIIINISGKIAIYPNPANDLINISVPEGFDAEKAEVFDVLGKRVMRLDQNFEEIDISQMEAGLYFIVVKDKEARVLSGKFVKE